jgi:hypothetical protein
MNKSTYEELEKRFQSYCRHDGGRTYVGEKTDICAICGWDLTKCQHRGETGKFCSQCGERLRGLKGE